MRTENYIDEFIGREKQTQHNPFLATRIMSAIEAPACVAIQPRVLLWQKLVVATCFVVVVASGIAVGNAFSVKSENYAGLNVNDSEIENFTFYNSESNE